MQFGKSRDTSLLGSICNNALRTIFTPVGAQRVSPAENETEVQLPEKQRNHSVGLMRVNHCGEVCAQALYQGQALFARDSKVRESLQEAADEEIDHLAWTSQRINELDGKLSVLNPIWYAGAFSVGALAALISDKVSLGFIAETEKQVSTHLQGHLDELPAEDLKSRAIVTQMDIDERQHATNAIEMGGIDLPQPVKQIMGAFGKVMTNASYWL